jgi:hypothetical protein
VRRFDYPSTICLNPNDTNKVILKYILQKSDSTKPKKRVFKELPYKNTLKITPQKPFSFINPAIEICYERKLNKHTTTQIMGAYLTNPSLYSTNSLKGFRTSIEQRWFYKKSAPQGPYLSFECNYLNKNYRVTDLFTPYEHKVKYHDDSTYYEDNYGVKKQTFTFNFKIGLQEIGKHLVVDMYLGLGLRHLNTTHYDRIGPNDFALKSRHPNFADIANAEAKGWVLVVPINARIGWAF